MPSKRLQLLIAAVAVLLAAAAGGVAYVSMSRVMRPTPVMVARAAVPPLTPLTRSDLRAETVPRGQLHGVWFGPGAAGALVGHMTLYGLYPGEIVSPWDVAPYSPNVSLYAARLTQMQKDAVGATNKAATALLKLAPGLSASVQAAETTAETADAPVAKDGPPLWQPPAQGTQPDPALQTAEQNFAAALSTLSRTERLQAVTVQVSETQGFAIVRPGDHVTMYGTVADEQRHMAAFVVGSGILVLGNLGSGPNGSLNGAVSGILVLALTPPEIERLMLAQQAGALQVGLEPLAGGSVGSPRLTSASLLTNTPSGPAPKGYGSVPSASSSGAVRP